MRRTVLARAPGKDLLWRCSSGAARPSGRTPQSRIRRGSCTPPCRRVSGSRAIENSVKSVRPSAVEAGRVRDSAAVTGKPASAEGHVHAVADILASRGIELTLDDDGSTGTAVQRQFRKRSWWRQRWRVRARPTSGDESASSATCMGGTAPPRRVDGGPRENSCRLIHRDRVLQLRRPAHGREPVAARRDDRRHQRARDTFRGSPGRPRIRRSGCSCRGSRRCGRRD